MKEYIPPEYPDFFQFLLTFLVINSCIISTALAFLLHYVSISIENLILMGMQFICKKCVLSRKLEHPGSNSSTPPVKGVLVILKRDTCLFLKTQVSRISV